ncbi:MAG: 4'-phosphopantetheinyl transferase superfamily protein [Bacteroidales bacterium]|nr:4'-phosphopantetheinyl transferase superfamily protein [Bacteroidales bacterium]
MVLTFFELNKITDDVFDVWLKKLPKFRQDEVLRYRFRDDRVRSLCAYLLLCVGLGRILEKFSYNEHGKPSLIGENLQINLSHAKSAVAVGFSKNPIGVDVEFIRKTYPKIVCKRVFTPVEIEQIENSDNPTLTFFKFWTLKESFVKCIGQGLTFPLKTVEFRLSDKRIDLQSIPFPSTSLRERHMPAERSLSEVETPDLTFSTFTQNEHQISICSTEKQEVKNLTFEELSKALTVIAGLTRNPLATGDSALRRNDDQVNNQ